MVVVARDGFECLCTFGKCVMVLVARGRIEPPKPVKITLGENHRRHVQHFKGYSSLRVKSV